MGTVPSTLGGGKDGALVASRESGVWHALLMARLATVDANFAGQVLQQLARACHANQENPNNPTITDILRVWSLGLFGSLGRQFSDRTRTMAQKQVRGEGSNQEHKQRRPLWHVFTIPLHSYLLPITSVNPGAGIPRRLSI
jgi:hypothetical protein